MPLNTRIIDTAKGNKARVSNDGALVVTTVPADSDLLAELGILVTASGAKKVQFLNGLMGSVGFGSGTTNMNVDGSVTPQNFYIKASNEYDIVITEIVVTITDGAVSLSKFGAIAELINGFDLTLFESGTTTPIITKAKTGGQILAQTGMLHPFGSGASTNIIASFSGNNDALIVPITFTDFIPDGLRITKGSLDYLVATVNDDLQLLVGMDIRILGHKLY